MEGIEIEVGGDKGKSRKVEEGDEWRWKVMKEGKRNYSQVIKVDE